MAPIKLASNCISNTTTISNLFLDKYMPAANGEFVKVYLCLLRMLTDPAKGSQTLSDLADLLSVTERDVVRALRYWESIGLISVEYDSQDYPAAITLNSLSQETSSFEASAPVVSVISEAPKIPEKVAAKDYKASAKPSSETACASEKTDEEFKELIFCAEHLLGTTLGPSDMDKLLYIYETLAFPVELIEYLIDYCVSNQKRSFRYIEKVALAWHEEGILTVEAAKQHHAIHNKRIYSCMNAFGIGDRTPVATEIEMINKWHDEYGFETEVIVEAITRTIQSIHKPSFEYTNTILQNWKEKGIHSVSDIALLDTGAKKTYFTTVSSKPSAPKQPVSAPVNNRFNNFKQRTYDFSELESRLVVKKGDGDEA